MQGTEVCWAHNGYIMGMLSDLSSATCQMGPCASHIISWDLLFLVTTWKKSEVAKGVIQRFSETLESHTSSDIAFRAYLIIKGEKLRY